MLSIKAKCIVAWCFIFTIQLNKRSGKQMQQPQQHSSTASSSKAKSGGFKKEVKAALSMLRHKLRLEQKQVTLHQDLF